MNDRGQILALDIHPITHSSPRELCAAASDCINTREAGRRLHRILGGVYQVLVDAPCQEQSSQAETDLGGVDAGEPRVAQDAA